MIDFDPNDVDDIVEKIMAEFEVFKQNSKHRLIKAQARRARKSSLRIEKLFKAYRKVSA